MSKTSILVENTTRDKLRQIGRKYQTYDQVINQLMELKKTQDSLESGVGPASRRIPSSIGDMNSHEQ